MESKDNNELEIPTNSNIPKATTVGELIAAIADAAEDAQVKEDEFAEIAHYLFHRMAKKA